ncbi:PREDICTED: cAMP-dependent protein kinase inhibitor beta [Chrysochloris asiatica]|uniref:cAMP-dependent protein kinase inhibitor beta n=1 Tax=Chrysochloris asiatica TaxID=185453 RepID=A0A9B0WGC5_CHRAS|nr:PREDICTED: cAMP-dependent protein kinase inhibitor beta [Chrysochloris asiatica]
MRTDSSEMTDVEPVVTNFTSSARAGRRNALPDIQSSVATGGTSDLPAKLEALSMKEGLEGAISEAGVDDPRAIKKEEHEWRAVGDNSQHIRNHLLFKNIDMGLNKGLEQFRLHLGERGVS